jgi:hypothetical protein
MQMTVRVDCSSDGKTQARPVRFWIKEHSWMVEEVLDRWYGRTDTFYRVRANDQNLYILRHSEGSNSEAWSLESFRDSGAQL